MKPMLLKRASDSDIAAIESGRRTLSIEATALQQLNEELEGPLGQSFSAAVSLMGKIAGRVIVTGMGKSGHVGQKVAATLASTGTPAFFVHPSEASHGDLGMIARSDLILALSWSGETVELCNMLTYAGRFRIPLIAVTAAPESALGRAASIVLQLPRTQEACPHGLAPTASTIMQLALGDSLAVALLVGKGFTAHDFKVLHPGGALGAQLRYVRDVMHRSTEMPLVTGDMAMSDALVIMTQKSFGCLGVIDHEGLLVGIITDGDLRRHMDRDLINAAVADIMTRTPNTIAPDVLASAALERITSSCITALFVVKEGRPIGIVHIHDLLRLGIR